MPSHTELLRLAVDLAHANRQRGGRPFGAVLARDGEVIATGINDIVHTHDPSAHAEMQALRAGTWRQASPSLGDFAGTLTFGENLVNATPQIIDPAVSLLDLDSANLDGGRVEIFYTQFGSPEDQLGVRNQGTGVAQIGVTGNTVSYNDGSGAVAIGTLGGGTNGSLLTIDLNANARDRKSVV